METFRRKYQVTLEEEDLIAKHVGRLLRGVFELKYKENVEEIIEKMMNTQAMSSDQFVLSYRQTCSVDSIVGILGEIRIKAKKRK
jgi:hypothetical protein